MTQWLTNPTSIHEDEDKGAALKDKRQKKKKFFPEFSCGSAPQGPRIVTAAALVAAVAQVQPLAWELLHALDVVKINK